MGEIVKAYVVNLDKRPDRMVSFNQNKFPFDVERVSAVEMTDGGVGCSYSHLNIFRKQNKFPFVIFEDDCEMVVQWSIVEYIMDQLPSEWDALWLGATLDAPLKRYSENLFRLKQAYCTYAIVYNSQRIIDYILNNWDNFFATTKEKPYIDVFYYYEVQEKFNCYITYPMVALQARGWSDVMQRIPREDEYQWRLDCYNKFTK